MPSEEFSPLDVRCLLESTGTPFRVARYLERTTLYAQGDPCDSVLYIEEGRVWLAITTPGGKEAICGLVEAGEFLGDEVLGGHVVRRQTATAMTTTDVLVVAKAHVTRLLHSEREFVDRFVSHTLTRNTRLVDDLACQLLYPTERRLAHTLLVLAGCDGRRPCRCTLPHVSQELIGEMIGSTRSRVNTFMGKFKKLGFIEEAGGALYVNPALLHVVGSGPRDGSRRPSAAPSRARAGGTTSRVAERMTAAAP